MENPDHSRWFHPSMYLYPDSTAMIANNSNGITQPYAPDVPTADHYYNHSTANGGGHTNDLSRPPLTGHGGGSGYLCHPVSPHSPPINPTENVGSCSSRLYMPNSCRNTPGLHSSNVSYNQSTIWPYTSVAGSLSLPQFSSAAHSVAHMKESTMPVDMSPTYNTAPDDPKLKLNQNTMQNFSPFPPHLYPQYGAPDYSSVGATAFDMLAGFQKCRTISRSNSGMLIIVCFGCSLTRFPNIFSMQPLLMTRNYNNSFIDFVTKH